MFANIQQLSMQYILFLYLNTEVFHELGKINFLPACVFHPLSLSHSHNNTNPSAL